MDSSTKTIEELVEELKPLLDWYEVPYPKDNDIFLSFEVKSAINKINNCRRFEPTDKVLYDKKYEDKIIPLTITGIMKMGAEGETSHSENGTMRSYSSGDKYPKEMLSDIVPLTKWW